MKKLGVIGLGNMGSAILKAVIKNKVFLAKNIIVNDIEISKSSQFKRIGAILAKDNAELASGSDIIILAVKPQGIRKVLIELKPKLTSSKIIISIAAGIKASFIENIINKKIQVIRVMPNMPLLVGSGVTSVCAGRFAKKGAIDAALKIFSSSGEVLIVKESDMDIVTALSGSGPAYFYFIIDAMVNCGIKLGLKKVAARKLVLLTALGSSKLLTSSKNSPAELITKIASKGGTTEAALKVFRLRKLERIIFEAVSKASKRSKEIERGLCSS